MASSDSGSDKTVASSDDEPSRAIHDLTVKNVAVNPKVFLCVGYDLKMCATCFCAPCSLCHLV